MCKGQNISPVCSCAQSSRINTAALQYFSSAIGRSQNVNQHWTGLGRKESGDLLSLPFTWCEFVHCYPTWTKCSVFNCCEFRVYIFIFCLLKRLTLPLPPTLRYLFLKRLILSASSLLFLAASFVTWLGSETKGDSRLFFGDWLQLLLNKCM